MLQKVAGAGRPRMLATNAESGSPALRRPTRCRHSHNQENAYMSYMINRMISDANIDDLDVRTRKALQTAASAC